MKTYFFILLSILLIDGLIPAYGARMKCQNVNIENGSSKVRSKGRVIVYKCDRGYYLLGESYAACIKGKWDSKPPVCLKPGCSTITNFTNGNLQSSWRSSFLRFSCNPGYQLVGPAYIYCNGKKWSSMQPYCKAIDITCNFEEKTTCNWEMNEYIDNDEGSDEFNWRLLQREPPSRPLKTGPLHDHTLSPSNDGHYLILDSSDYTSLSKPARINSPVFPLVSAHNTCFIFWYHMYGSTVGTLNVLINNVLTFQQKGNHGDRWIKGVVPLNEISNSSSVQVTLEGIYGGGYTGDIGLDDFTIGNGTDCNSTKVASCVGRCYEEHEDQSICLCNPECLADSSCCKDFVQVCSLETTTPFFEASTVVDGMSQAFFDTFETTVTEMYTSVTDTDISSTFEEQTETDTFSAAENQYLTLTIASSIDNDSNTPFYSSDRVHSEKKGNNLITNVYSTSVPPLTKNSDIKTNTSGFLKRTSTASTLYIQLEMTIPETKENNITQKDFPLSKNTTTNSAIENFHSTKHPKLSSNAITSTYLSQNGSISGVSSIYNTNKIYNSFKKTKATTYFILYNNNISLHDSPPSSTIDVSRSTTKLPLIENSPKVKWFNDNQKKSLPIISTTKIPTTVSSQLNSKSLNEKQTWNPITTETIGALSNFNNTVTSSLKNNPKPFQYYNYTFSTNLNKLYLSTKMPFVTSSSSKKIEYTTNVNDSHTHLQSTPQTSLVYSTTKETDTLSSKETIAVPYGKHIIVNNSKKWTSKYKPKERFVYSAARRNKSDGNETILSLFLFLFLFVCTLTVVIVILFFKRRRSRFINEVEEADTDILYRPSQELLDLHYSGANL